MQNIFRNIQNLTLKLNGVIKAFRDQEDEVLRYLHLSIIRTCHLILHPQNFSTVKQFLRFLHKKQLYFFVPWTFYWFFSPSLSCHPFHFLCWFLLLGHPLNVRVICFHGPCPGHPSLTTHFPGQLHLVLHMQIPYNTSYTPVIANFRSPEFRSPWNCRITLLPAHLTFLQMSNKHFKHVRTHMLLSYPLHTMADAVPLPETLFTCHPYPNTSIILSFLGQ